MIIGLGSAILSSMLFASEAAPHGYELYCWQPRTGTWNFALLSMTSRNKTPKEIRNPKTALDGETELKKKLGELRRNTTVILQPIPLEPIPQAYPATEILTDLRSFAETHGVILMVMDQKSGGLK
jgi:hypothetical protein